MTNKCLLLGMTLLLKWSTCVSFSGLSRVTCSSLHFNFAGRYPNSFQRRRLELLNTRATSVRLAASKPANLVELPAGTLLRVYAISDLHVDRAANLELVQAGWTRDDSSSRELSSTFTSAYQARSTRKASSTLNNKNIHRKNSTYDVLVVAGDVAANLVALEAAFEALKTQYDDVVCVPGNHELWVKAASSFEDDGDAGTDSSSSSSSANSNASSDSNDPGNASSRDGSSDNSLAKLEAVMHLAQRYGVHTEPVHFDVAADDTTSAPTSASASSGGASSSKQEGYNNDNLESGSNSDNGARVCIFPLHSWYAAGWDKEPELEGNAFPTRFFASAWADFRFCRWPVSLVSGDSIYLTFFEIRVAGSFEVTDFCVGKILGSILIHYLFNASLFLALRQS